jgi:endoribonuclease Dicer
MGWGNVDEVQEDSDVNEYMPDYETTNGNESKISNDIENEMNEMNGDDSDDDEPGADDAHPARTVSEKRRVENAIFRMYATLRTAKITEKEVKEVTKNLTDDKLSIRDILAKEENSRKIINPRDYQTELFQRAKEENIIAVLDTGTGKTHIATLLLRHILDTELESRAKGLPPKVAFFLVS